MALLVLFCVAMVLGGTAIVRLALRETDAADWQPGPWEKVATSVLAALALALAIGWLLLLAHVFVGWALLVAAAIVLVLSARSTKALVETLRHLDWKSELRTGKLVSVLALVVVGLWLVLNVAAGSQVFFQNNDALGYHMPHAVLLVKARAFHVFDMHDARATWPIDFELLLAETIALTDKDIFTSFVPAFGAVLFLTQAAAMVERWWGRGVHVLVVTLVLAAMPIMILHTSTHKNDTFECGLTLAALRLAAMWIPTRAPWLPFASAAAAVMAIGFKLSGGIVGVVTAAILCRGFLVRRSETGPHALAKFTFAAMAFALLLGGFSFAYNLATIHRPFLNIVFEPPMMWHYENLWRYLYVSVVAPYATSLSRAEVSVPWGDRPWSVVADDPFFSNFGVVVPILLGSLPFALFRYRGQASTARFERAMTILPCLAVYGVIVGLDSVPVGFYVGSTRFLLFLPAILADLTLAPAVRELATRKAVAGLAIIGLATGLLVFEAYTYAYQSETGVVRLALEVMSRPALRRAGQQPRAAYVVDRVARAKDVVAMDAGYDSFNYPLYGEGLTREVRYLHGDRPEPIKIDDDVRWVAIDRGWHCMFGNPEFRDFGDWRYFARGEPTPTDRRVYDLVKTDPRFKLVWENPMLNQAVFVRVRKP